MTDIELQPPVELAGKTIDLFDLAPPSCPECGQWTTARMFMAVPSGCSTCDEILTRHRCIGGPLAYQLDEGAEWTCDGCGAVYRVQVEIEEIEHRTWQVASPAVREGPRTDAPRCRRANGYYVHVQPGCRCSEKRWPWR